MLSKEVIEWLNKVRREARRVARFDKASSGDTYDETQTVFLYVYDEFSIAKEEYITYNVIIIMNKGEYIDYYFKEVENG